MRFYTSHRSVIRRSNRLYSKSKNKNIDHARIIINDIQKNLTKNAKNYKIKTRANKLLININIYKKININLCVFKLYIPKAYEHIIKLMYIHSIKLINIYGNHMLPLVEKKLYIKLCNEINTLRENYEYYIYNKFSFLRKKLNGDLIKLIEDFL